MIMDYEKLYKDALERARNLYKDAIDMEDRLRAKQCEIIFPELAESEDERIREALIRFHKSTIDIDGIKGEDIIAWLEKQCEPQDKGEISDGYHTFNELYYYRMLYNAAFFNLLPKEWVHKSKKHHDGEECFGGGWFIVMANLPTGQISNHYELKYWELFHIPEKDVADEWDGHTPKEAAERLHKCLLGKQGEKKSDDNVETKFKAGDWVVFANGNVGRITSAGTEWQKQQEYKDSELKLMNEHDKAKKFIFELCRVYDITDSNGYAVDSKSLISEFESYMKGE